MARRGIPVAQQTLFFVLAMGKQARTGGRAAGGMSPSGRLKAHASDSGRISQWTGDAVGSNLRQQSQGETPQDQQ